MSRNVCTFAFRMEDKKTSQNHVVLSDSARALLDRARRYCALSEQCESGVRQKLISWGAASDVVPVIVDRLQSEDYLNDVRYARAFCEGKLVHQCWGRQKVLYHLRAKHLPKEAIEEGMAVVDDETYYRILNAEAEKKLRILGGEMTPEVRRKMLSFLVSRGYSTSDINRVLG